MILLDSLQRLVLDSLPKKFFERLILRQPVLYEEAREMAFSAPWAAPEAESVFPHNRRGLIEHEVRLSAIDNELLCADSRHLGDNCGYVLVCAGKLRVTVHHVDKPTRFVPSCRSRQQHAAVNEWLETPYFEELMQELPPQLGEADAANAYLLHGLMVEKRGDESFSTLFMRIAFPDADLAKYVRNYNVLDLLQLYDAEEGFRSGGSGPDGGGLLPDNAHPVINIKPDKELIQAKSRNPGA